MTEENKMTEVQAEEPMYPASEVLVGVRQNQMIINGQVYCDTCWCIRPDDKTLCPCQKDEVRTCEDCSNTKDPCLFCQPTHHANHKIAMAEMEKILADMEEAYPSCVSSVSYKESQEDLDYQKHYWDEDDADYREHKYEY